MKGGGGGGMTTEDEKLIHRGEFYGVAATSGSRDVKKQRGSPEVCSLIEWFVV